MGNLFVLEDFVKPYILAVDRTLLKSKRSCVARVINERRDST